LCQRPYHFFKAAFEYLLHYYLIYFGDSAYKKMLHPIEDIALQDSTTLFGYHSIVEYKDKLVLYKSYCKIKKSAYWIVNIRQRHSWKIGCAG